jgi:hypothetical protein
LDGLESNYIGSVTQYSFSKMLAQGIPSTQNKIKGTVTDSLKEWLARYIKA